MDYNPGLVGFGADGVHVNIKQDPAKPDESISSRISTTRYLKYGRVSMVLTAPPLTGIVTTFVTMGPQLPDTRFDMTKVLATGTTNCVTKCVGGDEIDFEILGRLPNTVQTNVFYRGFAETGGRGGTNDVPNGVQTKHKYTIDWTKDKIDWLIDDVKIRTYSRTSPEANNSPNLGGKDAYFPDRAQRVQFALWSKPMNEWAGKAIQWPTGTTSTAGVFESLEIQCYNDKMQPVPKWPLNAGNPDRGTDKSAGGIGNGGSSSSSGGTNGSVPSKSSSSLSSVVVGVSSLWSSMLIGAFALF